MSAINSLIASTDTNATAEKSKGLKTEDFLKIMIEELQHQDPFEPMSSKDLVVQIGQIQGIQSSMELTATLKDLSLNQKLAAAGSILGKLVSGNEGQIEVSGLVTAVKVEGDKVFLELDSGERLSIDNVLQIQDADAETLAN